MEQTPQDSGPTDPSENGPLSFSGISILDRLIKTCPVWLQLCMGAPQVVEVLRNQASGVFLVTRDAELQVMVLWVRSPEGGGAADLLHYNIREEKTMMCVEGSMLLFKDIFKLVAFYCISRDILPSVLKLPSAISAARSLQELEEISNLGTGFWDSSSSSEGGKSAGNLRTHDSGRTPRASRELCDCACEVELAAGNDRLWFVSPIFIEECGNVAPSDQLPLTNCIVKPEIRLPKIMHRRPPPPPPMLHKPPLPSVPPSAPPPNYIGPQADSSPLRSPAPPRPSTSERRAPETPSAAPPPSSVTSAAPPPSSVTSAAPPPSSVTSAAPPPSSVTSAVPPPSSVTSVASPPSSVTSAAPPPTSAGTSAVTLPTLLRTSPEPPPPSGTSAEPPPSSGTSAEPPPSGTSAEPPPPSGTSAEPPPPSGTSAEPSSSATPTQCCSPEPPQSLLQGSSSKTSIHNLVDLQDLSSVTDPPIHSAPSDAAPVPDPPPGSGRLLSQPDSSLLLFTNEEQALGAPPDPSDLDFPTGTVKNMKINVFSNDSPQAQGSPTAAPVRAPPAVPRRRPSGKTPENQISIFSMKEEEEVRRGPSQKTPLTSPEKRSPKVENGRKNPPVPPPRIKKMASRSTSMTSEKGRADARGVLETEGGKAADRKVSRHKRLPTTVPRTSDPALASPGSDPTMVNPEADSYSTSSAEEDSEPPASASIKKSHSFMLDRAKNRLSIVAITNVFSAFMSSDRKLQKRISELAHDKDSYFGNLVQDYKAYSLEMMAKQSSSTEMLQEIRLMMTQLKSYLVQSAELKAMVDYTLYTDDKIDAIVEAALCKCVLKPLKSAIECYLREIHNKDGSLRLLTENQQVIQDTTTTDLGVTTSVPDSSVMEKILHKFGTMHKTYSPEKKITYLLKACKLIYDSMAAGNPGKHHGADDFLPVLMYVLAQCDLVGLLLDVEYMMELMDPALQLGEGSYYLTTTYGALEHIKNYDKITVTRQLSVEVQDSIHRWERRRTLNKAKVSRSSIQDFITIALEELDSKTRTLATKPDMSVAEVLRQCAEKFEVSEPAQYGLFVQVNGRCLRLPEDAVPQQVKSRLLKNEQKLDFHFLYRRRGAQDAVMDELDFL